MDPLKILQSISFVRKFLPQIEQLKNLGIGGITPQTVSTMLKEFEPLLSEFGAQLSPSAPEHVHAVIYATSLALEGHPGGLVQEALNLYLKSVPGFVPLVVDGILGPKSSAAILMAQVKAGIKADGWFGKATAIAIGYVLK